MSCILTTRGSEDQIRTVPGEKKTNAVSQPSESSVLSSFSRGREELIKFPDEFAILAAYIIPYAGSRRTRKIYTYIHTLVAYVYVHLSRSSCRRGRCFQSQLYLVELESFLLSRFGKNPPKAILLSLLTLPPLFLVFFFSLPLFLARSKALLGTSLRFSRA